MDVELLTLINNFKNTIALNNVLIKEKIIRKLDMIKVMQYYGFPIMNFPVATGNKIIDELRRVDKLGDIINYTVATNNTNKLLGSILHNSYQASGYNVILSNIPINGITALGESINIDSEAIYETLCRYTDAKSVLSICQISADTYLAKLDTNDNAQELCNLLNAKMLEGNIIKVEFIDSIELVDNEMLDVLNPKLDQQGMRVTMNAGLTSTIGNYFVCVKNFLGKVLRKLQFWK